MTQPQANLFDPTAVFQTAGEVVRELGPGKMVAVEGAPGSGRNTLVRRVAGTLGPSAVVVHVPPGEDADAPVHSLLQTAACLGSAAVSAAASGTSKPLWARAGDVVDALARTDRQLVLHVPDSAHKTITDDDPAPGWLESLVELLRVRGGPQLAIALVLPAHSLRQFKHHLVFKRFQLPSAPANIAALCERHAWGEYADAAARLWTELKKPRPPVSPLQVRLMVGLVALGLPSQVVAQSVHGSEQSSLEPLVRYYANILASDEHATLRGCVRRFLLAREPLKTEDAFDLSDPTPQAKPLLRYCLGYGDSTVRVPDYVRSALLNKLKKSSGEELTHKKLADYHEKSDGALDAGTAAKSPPGLRHWLEKVHHLAHAGLLGAEAWSKQELTSREFLIDRARALSIEHERYADAAALYQRCLQLSADDGYALHYRGYNLDRTGQEPAEVERCFRGAVTKDRRNIYYNSRLVTFLIEQGRPLDADRAWEAALANVASRDADDVARHMTRHVTAAWLDAGDVRRARVAFDTLPLDSVETYRPLERLQERLLDLEEATAMNVAVYPARVPIAQRWTAPRLAQASWQGRPRKLWGPGRVTSFEDGVVTFAWVMPSPDPKKRRVLTGEKTEEKWRALGGQLPAQSSLYFEIAEYDGLEDAVVFTDPAPPEEPVVASEAERPHPLRYLMTPIKGSPLG